MLWLRSGEGEKLHLQPKGAGICLYPFHLKTEIELISADDRWAWSIGGIIISKERRKCPEISHPKCQFVHQKLYMVCTRNELGSSFWKVWAMARSYIKNDAILFRTNHGWRRVTAKCISYVDLSLQSFDYVVLSKMIKRWNVARFKPSILQLWINTPTDILFIIWRHKWRIVKLTTISKYSWKNQNA
jgi:hypothetical protein